MAKVVLGYAPTRRSISAAPDAVKYANLTRERLRELGVEFVDIDDIAEDGLLHDDGDRIRIGEKFRAAGVDGLFFPHGNFGTEYEVARLAKELNVPVLLWGPRDERPDENGIRNLLAVCNVVKTFRRTRILQIGPRPFDFWSTMCNEGELLERFHIQLAPVPMPELTEEMRRVKEEKSKVEETIRYCRENFKIAIKDEELENVAALKVAMKNLAEKYGCNAIAIQCWNALQGEIGIMPCAANSLLNEEGLPVVCETDIHGAITAVMAEAAGMDEARTFFADWTVRHPDNENGELLQHCGPWPLSVASCKPTIGYPLAFSHPGAVEAEAKHGDMTLCRFDGDNGEYSLLLGNAKGVDGPYTKGTYVWVEVKNLKKLEAKVVEGPYIHHCVGIHKDVVPVLYEACKYLGIQADLYDDNEDEVKGRVCGYKP